jgi:hypothetical protein
MGIRISELPKLITLSKNDLFVVVQTDSNTTKYMQAVDLNLGQLIVGNPTSGSYNNGYVVITSSSLGADIIQSLNNELSILASTSHQQNTDIGTTNNSFLIHISGSSSVLLKEVNNSLLLRNTTDSAYAGITGSNALFDNLDAASTLNAYDLYVNNNLSGSGAYFSGNITADSLYARTLIVSSSTIWSSGSTKFGDSLDDTHQFTGMVSITGSFGVNNILNVDNDFYVTSSTMSILNGNIKSVSINTTSITLPNISNNQVVFSSASVLVGNSKFTYDGNDVTIIGGLQASYKSFKIPHPTQEGKTLIYGSLEGPEHGVYVRGFSESEIIYLPEYWTKLVDEATITVQITPIGGWQRIYVDKIQDNAVYLKQSVSSKLFGIITNTPFKYFYMINGERKDISKLKSEL